MSNRKYAAAVLSDGSASIEEQMDAACAILSEIMDIAIKDTIEHDGFSSIASMNTIKMYLNTKYKEMFPELYKKYEVTIGMVDGESFRPGQLVIAWKKRIYSFHESRLIFHPNIEAEPFPIHHISYPEWVQQIHPNIHAEVADHAVEYMNGFMGGNDQVRLDNYTVDNNGNVTANVTVTPNHPLEYITMDLNLNLDPEPAPPLDPLFDVEEITGQIRAELEEHLSQFLGYGGLLMGTRAEIEETARAVLRRRSARGEIIDYSILLQDVGGPFVPALRLVVNLRFHNDVHRHLGIELNNL